jgi:hypothetical protein
MSIQDYENFMSGPLQYSPRKYSSTLATDYSFATPGIVTVKANASLVAIEPNKINLQSGKCPQDYNNSCGASKLPAITLTAPTEASIVYNVYEKKRYRNEYTNSCSGFSKVAQSAELVLTPGTSVEYRPQKSGGGYMYGKEINLVRIETVPSSNNTVPSNLQNADPTNPGNNFGYIQPAQFPSWAVWALIGGVGIVAATTVGYVLVKKE